MRYIIIQVGCLCCGTASRVVGTTSDRTKAEELCDHVNYGVRDTRYECQYFEVPDEDTVDPRFDEAIERGKEYKEELDAKIKAHMARKSKPA